MNNPHNVKSQACRITSSPHGYEEAASEERYANCTIYLLESSLKKYLF